MADQELPRSKLLRRAVWAGQFYPGNPAELRQTVQFYLDEAKLSAWCQPKAIIAPHAGYIYSGPIAGSAFAQFACEAQAIQKIILLGPSHRLPFRGLALSSAAAFTTPLGEVPVDRELTQRLVSLPCVQVLDAAHLNEHSLEVELPFLQVALSRFSVLPLVVGEADDQDVAAVLEAVWGGPESRIVVSTDLSHYHPYREACKTDQETARAIETLQPEHFSSEHACGATPIRGLLCAARDHHLQAHTVDLRNSGDTAGSRDRVVGYGAFIFC